MGYVTKRHIIKIPKNVSIYYCDTKRIIIFANLITQKALKLKTRLIIEKEERIIKVTRMPFFEISNNEKKKLKAVQGTQVSLLKQMLLDISVLFCRFLICCFPCSVHTRLLL